MKKILSIVGARPQFIKHCPFELACRDHFELVTIHTGQHYDENMSKVFFDELKIKKPDYFLEIGGGGHGVQTGKMMIKIEEIVEKIKPDVINVYGDTNSTLAGALVSSKLHIKLVHIEAGLRSFNKEMPEEVNRILTDHVSDTLFVTGKNAVENLEKEGIKNGVHIVGDLMKDLIFRTINSGLIKEKKVLEPYYYSTLHRPYNTDSKDRLSLVLENLNNLDKKIYFSIHPRTRKSMKQYQLLESNYKNIVFIEPQSYFDNLTMLFNADALITDSGGMQKEAYWLEKRCVTIRTETEWVETLEDGWNSLFFDNLENLSDAFSPALKNHNKALYGSGNSAEKIVKILSKYS